MKGRAILLGAAVMVLVVVLPATVAAQQPDPDPPDFGETPVFAPQFGAPEPADPFPAFGVFIVVGLLGAAATSLWKFGRIRDMGINRGMSDRDATTMAIFSDESTVSGLIVGDALGKRRREDHRKRLPRNPVRPPQSTVAEPNAKPDQATFEERLEKIAKLRTKGLITAQEAQSRRAEILDEI